MGKAVIALAFVFALVATLAAWIGSALGVRNAPEVMAVTRSAPDQEHYAFFLRHSLDKLDRRRERIAVEPVLNLVESWNLPETVTSLFKDYVRARAGGEMAEESRQAIFDQAEVRPAIRFANGFAGDLLLNVREMEKAAAHYRVEADFPDAEHSRRQLVRIALETKNLDEMKEIVDDARFNLQDYQSLIQIGVRLRDPGLILRGVLAHDFREMSLLILPLTLLAGAVWFLIVLKICYIPPGFNASVAAGIVALALGVLSTTLTLFFVIVQENIMGFTSNGEPINDFIYYVCGVGVREELCKLALFLPLVPWLYKRRDPKTVIVAASCVGLGFAIQENLGYFETKGTEAAFGRFVTANCLHMALTALFGYAFCRFLYSPSREWDRLAGTFVLVVVAHGLYDFVIVTGNTFFAIFVLALIIHAYLKLVRTHCTPNRQIISPLGIFVVGSACILGLTWTTASIILGHVGHAANAIGPQVLSAIPIMFLFINQLRHD